jgi:hypothetical protein
MAEAENTIPFDRAREQIEKSLTGLPDQPRIAFEKGLTMITFPVGGLGETEIAAVLGLMKTHLENVRIHGFGDGYFAFQAMNRNLFQSEGLLDNFKVELFGLTGSFRVELSKKGNLSQEEVGLAVEIFRYFRGGATEDPVTLLRKLGASVYVEHDGPGWSYIAGYEEVKKRIRESIILPLQNPDVYDAIARLTRHTFESNRPRAVLFEGPPGVGKTTVARIIAGEVKVPLVYLPVESIVSKWYGQSSRNLAQIFDLCDALGRSILFLDEIDSLAGSRDSNMFEATRRVLSVLLRKLDGIEAAANTITIGATNRKGDLDPALISRFDQSIQFPLPDGKERAAIFGGYAKHLAEADLTVLAQRSDGLSGRNIKDVCESAERRWARRLIVRGESASPPPLDYYRYTVAQWNRSGKDEETGGDVY